MLLSKHHGVGAALASLIARLGAMAANLRFKQENANLSADMITCVSGQANTMDLETNILGAQQNPQPKCVCLCVCVPKQTSENASVKGIVQQLTPVNGLCDGGCLSCTQGTVGPATFVVTRDCMTTTAPSHMFLTTNAWNLSRFNFGKDRIKSLGLRKSVAVTCIHYSTECPMLLSERLCLQA
eukprot:2279587-Amphidinium_carterae.1